MSWDPYLDLQAGVLRNRLGIADKAELAQAEAELTGYRLIELQLSPMPGRYDLNHLQAFHRHIFGDVYDWPASCGLSRSARASCSASRNTSCRSPARCSAGSLARAICAAWAVPSSSIG